MNPELLDVSFLANAPGTPRLPGGTGWYLADRRDHPHVGPFRTAAQAVAALRELTKKGVCP